jgi:transposase
VVVCDPRKNALLKAGNKNDWVDARKLSDLLRAGLLTPVYHEQSAIRTLRELSRSYLAVSKDLTRVMNRLKAIYRSWAIPCAGQQVYSPRRRAAWLEKLREAGVRRRAEQTYQQLDFLMAIRKETRNELLAESRKHSASQLLQQIPRLGPIRAALLIALL